MPPTHTPSTLGRLPLGDGLFALLLLVAATLASHRYGTYMDSYEHGILWASAMGMFSLGRYWKPFQLFLPICGALALFSIQLYSNDLAMAERKFWLKYLIASQPAIMWMSALYFLATITYWLSLLARSRFAGQTASAMTWIATGMGVVGMLVRWYESYLLGPDIGHIPVSNLYEVFILFCLMTALLYLYYEQRYQNRQLGAFVLLVISAAVLFLLWYMLDRQAHTIQPLIPALQSWWMKLHVPANFVGYGAFALSAMLGIAFLLSTEGNPSSKKPFWLAAATLLLAGTTLHLTEPLAHADYWANALITIGILLLIEANRGRMTRRLPAPAMIDEIMYKSIAIGFAFFTIATILGAMWAADAWGGYWSWDPKETWALIVWLNYAAWLHMRLVKGLRGAFLAWWAVIGLFVTTFAFLGVNMWLSGLHSYGSL